MKFVLACLSVRKYLESHCAWRSCEARASLSMCGKHLMKPFNHLGDAVKHVQACLSGREFRESCFHHCGGPVKLLQAHLCARKT